VYASSAPAPCIAGVMNEHDPHSASKDNPEVIPLHYAVFCFKDLYLSPHIFIASHNLEDTRVPDKSSTRACVPGCQGYYIQSIEFQ
jgi:hypothetical protein